MDVYKVILVQIHLLGYLYLATFRSFFGIFHGSLKANLGKIFRDFNVIFRNFLAPIFKPLKYFGKCQKIYYFTESSRVFKSPHTSNLFSNQTKKSWKSDGKGTKKRGIHLQSTPKKTVENNRKSAEINCIRTTLKRCVKMTET